MLYSEILIFNKACFPNAIVDTLYYFRGFDDEMRAVVARNLEGRGIHLHPQTNLTEVLHHLLIPCFLQLVCEL